MTTATSIPQSLTRIEDYPGYNHRAGCLTVSGERLVEERCPNCGSRMLVIPLGIADAMDCPWCMTHRGGEGDDGLAARVAAAGIPKRYAELEPTWGHIKSLKAGDGLWLEGRGSGRTAFACRTLGAWLRDGGSGMFVSAYELFSARTEAINAMYVTGLLVIDGLGGAGEPGGWGIQKLGAVVDVRHREKRPIIVTSEHSPSEAVARLGAGTGVAEVIAKAMETCRRVAA